MVSPQLAVWLPATLHHSDAAAARLVAFLPPPHRHRLRTVALCLVRVERGLSAPLPTPIGHRLLGQVEKQQASLHSLQPRGNEDQLILLLWGSVALILGCWLLLLLGFQRLKRMLWRRNPQ